MNKFRAIAAIVGVAGVLALGAACSNGEAATTPEPSQPVTGAPAASSGGTTPPVGAPPSVSGEVRSGGSGSPVPVLYQSAGSQTGIWVTGQGTMSVEPDLALINIGVETEAKTVTEARDQAAIAMDAIIAAVKARGLTDADIQTTSFNIWPRYDFNERTRVLVGYTVSNSASIKVRDLDSLGNVIDDVANAGGNATRINGINFTVEDTTQFMNELRQAAVADAMSKAQQFATLTGVNLGALAFISESGGGSPVVSNFDRGVSLEMSAAAAPPTSISSGELTLRLSVQAAYGIQ